MARCTRFLQNDGDGVLWDMVAFVEYPSLGAFKSMIESGFAEQNAALPLRLTNYVTIEDYLGVYHLREEALANGLLCATEAIGKVLQNSSKL